MRPAESRPSFVISSTELLKLPQDTMDRVKRFFGSVGNNNESSQNQSYQPLEGGARRRHTSQDSLLSDEGYRYNDEEEIEGIEGTAAGQSAMEELGEDEPDDDDIEGRTPFSWVIYAVFLLLGVAMLWAW